MATCIALSTVAVLSMPELASQVLMRLSSGARLLTLYGQARDDQSVVVTALLRDATGSIGLLRARARAGDTYEALTNQYPGAQILERELWEQTGLMPSGHPWLKPVRYEGQRQERMADHPFFTMTGREIHEVGVGPIHAGVIEPGHFRFMCLGETVHHLEIQLGYQHRGVESLLRRTSLQRLHHVVESICGDCSVTHAWAHADAIEALRGVPASIEQDLMRAIGLEMERVAIHLANLSALAGDLALIQASGTYGRLRTAIINAVQRICGNRFGRGWIRTARPLGITPAGRHDLATVLSATRHDFVEVNRLMFASAGGRARLKGLGRISTDTAQALSLAGLVARASGVQQDERREGPGPAYQCWPTTITTASEGDCWARMVVRMQEVEQSIDWIQDRLGDARLDLQAMHGQAPAATGPLLPEALSLAMIEGPRGPVLHSIETDPQGQILHYKVQDPSLFNWFGLAMALRGEAISDFPVCNKSFDLSYCGNDL